MLDSTPVNSSVELGTSGPLVADRSAIASWLELVHPTGEDGYTDGLIHICSVGNWDGRTFSEHPDAVDYIMRLDAEGAQGIYLRTTSLATVPKDYSRGSAVDSKILPGFAADMDIAGPGHAIPKQGPLPRDEAACRAIVAAANLPEPTLWVHSGGGVYPWWMLDEGLDISAPADREWATTVSDQLHTVLNRHAEALGWFYSTAVKDMARVLRIPGTVNRKPNTEPRLAQIIQPASYEFYSMGALAEAVADAYAAMPAPRIVEPPRPAPAPRPSGVLTPGDDFNSRAHWADILVPHGWTYMYHRGATMYWRRPGKDTGEHSATTGRKGIGSEDRLYVFSDATEFEANLPYNKHAAYTLLNHGGLGATHFASSTRDLRGQGFGGDLPKFDYAPDALSLVGPAAQVPAAVKAVDQQQPAQAALVVQADQPAAVVVHETSLPEIDLGSEQESMIEIRRVVNSGMIPHVYAKDGQLVYVHPKNNTTCSEVTVVPVTADLLNLLLAENVRTFKWISGGKDKPLVRKACAPSITQLRAVVSSSHWPDVAELTGVVGTPTLRADGSLIQECGYDQATGLFYGPAVKVAAVPDQISEEQTRISREFVFSKVFGEFCWSSAGDFANYMALLLSPMLRPYTKTTTPFGMVTATTRGSGKTNLTDAIGLLYGQTSQVLPGRTEELQKKITSILAGNSSPVVVFDNLKEGTTVSSEILATLITKDKWDDRMLGASRNIEATNDRLWLASGNGLTVGGDMASRTVMVRLDPKMAKPELRKFEMGQFSDWIREADNREELLWHLLVLVQAWVKAGADVDDSHTMRGFTRWAQVMGGLLKYHGLTGFLGNADDLAARDTDEEEWGIFLAKWHEVFGPSEQMARQVHASAQVDWVMGTSIDRWSRCFITDDEGLTPTPKKLGQMLHGKADRFFGVYILRKRRDTVTNSTMWWVEKGDA